MEVSAKLPPPAVPAAAWDEQAPRGGVVVWGTDTPEDSRFRERMVKTGSVSRACPAWHAQPRAADPRGYSD